MRKSRRAADVSREAVFSGAAQANSCRDVSRETFLRKNRRGGAQRFHFVTNSPPSARAAPDGGDEIAVERCADSVRRERVAGAALDLCQ
jgi:hypothetical protein